MRLRLAATIAALLVGGCATQNSATKTFYVQENSISRACLAPYTKMSAEQRFTVDTQSGRSPISSFTRCYSDQIKAAAQMTQYPHAATVNAYADYLLRLTAAQDRGEIERSAAIISFRQAAKLFDQSIASADAQQAAQARRAFADRLAMLGTAIAEQDRQRVNNAAANRPVVCTSTGVYARNGFVCN
jgi:hypothetical protein